MISIILIGIDRVFGGQDDLALIDQKGAEGVIALFPGTDGQIVSLADKWFMNLYVFR